MKVIGVKLKRHTYIFINCEYYGLINGPSVAEKEHSIFVVEGAGEEEQCPTDE